MSLNLKNSLLFITAIMHTLISGMLITIIGIIAAPFFLVYILIPVKYRFNSPCLFFLVHIFYLAILKATFIPVTYIGAKRFPKRPSIIIANHQSSLDVPILGVLNGSMPHIWLALADLMRMPMLRILIPWFAVLVDLSSPRKAVSSLDEAVAVAGNKKCHILLFPEGGRYQDGQVHDFFRGFSILARLTHRAVVPVRIYGVNKVYPRDAWLLRWHPVTVVVGEPMSMQEGENDHDFKDRVRNWFLTQDRDRHVA